MADAVYLKKETRIQSLAVVMCICLLVYSITQRKLRLALKDKNETVPNQLGKQIQNPTLKWIFQIFHCIHVAYQDIDGEIQKIVSNLDDLRMQILRLLGPPYQRRYLVFDS